MRLVSSILSLGQDSWTGHRTVELEGPARVTPLQIASEFTKVLGRTIRTEIVPRESWKALFDAQGMNNPAPRIAMLDGFNQGWIEFEGAPETIRKGKTSIGTVIRALVERT